MQVELEVFWDGVTEAMIVATKAPISSADILLNSNKLNVVETFKYLRVTVDSCLNWERHISQLIERVSSQIALLNRLAGFLRHKNTSADLQTNNPPSDRLWMYRMA